MVRQVSSCVARALGVAPRTRVAQTGYVEAIIQPFLIQGSRQGLGLLRHVGMTFVVASAPL